MISLDLGPFGTLRLLPVFTGGPNYEPAPAWKGWFLIHPPVLYKGAWVALLGRFEASQKDDIVIRVEEALFGLSCSVTVEMPCPDVTEEDGENGEW